MVKLRGQLPSVETCSTSLSLPVRWIDLEYDDAVVTTIRAVEKLARWRHVNVGTITRSAEIARQRRNSLDRCERSFWLVVFERRHRRIEFVDDVEIFARRVKRQMARSGAGLKLREWLFAGLSFPVARSNR